MSQPTQNYRRSLSGSIGSGMKSIMGGDDRRFYVLEHKVSSRYHHAGESQRIIVDEIEIGRDSKCQVRFDESFQTVSRRHAAIVKDGDNWKLVQLSQTNSTYLNGHRVEKEWYLQSGDEIQLSTNGPKLGFIVPQGEKGLVKSIGLTARLNLFGQQALRPYKTAIASLACILLVVMTIGSYALYNQHQKIIQQEKTIAENKEKFDKYKIKQDSIFEAQRRQIEDNDRKMADMQKKLSAVQREAAKLKTKIGSVDNAAIEPCLAGVYFIVSSHFEITLPDGRSGYLECGKDGVPGWTGTGFLLDDGTFVTARHVVCPWDFWNDGEGVKEDMVEFNKIDNNGGSVAAVLMAISSSGKTITLNSNKFRIDKSHDKRGTKDDGTKLSLAAIDNTDYAYMNLSSSAGGLTYDASKSNNLERGEPLTVLGFPLGLGASSEKISPVYGSAIVAAPGLENGIILTTDTNYEHGNSGGPVFYTDDSGKLVVVGIVSAGAGRNIGCVVPISQVK